jgi:glycosidase
MILPRMGAGRRKTTDETVKNAEKRRQPPGRRRSVSGQAAERADATADPTASERPLHDYAAERNERGPTLCFRGIDNTIFYMLADEERSYRDYTGTGNTMNANYPVVRNHILAALRYWMVAMHVDGFRFDLASVLGRDGNGKLLANAPLLDRIAEDPILRDVKIIAEAWDAAGADAIDFGLPPLLPGARWYLAIDTSRETPQDLFAAGEEPLWEDPHTYHLPPRSSSILLVRGTNCQRQQTALTEAK